MRLQLCMEWHEQFWSLDFCALTDGGMEGYWWKRVRQEYTASAVQGEVRQGLITGQS